MINSNYFIHYSNEDGENWSKIKHTLKRQILFYPVICRDSLTSKKDLHTIISESLTCLGFFFFFFSEFQFHEQDQYKAQCTEQKWLFLDMSCSCSGTKLNWGNFTGFIFIYWSFLHRCWMVCIRVCITLPNAVIFKLDYGRCNPPCM